jgi:ABC-type transport system involved in multi-copper enzyme maturation permease subunit
LFFVMAVASMNSLGAGRGLGDLAKTASQTFTFISIVQLGLMCFLAPIFTAAAITQEKDAQTYSILLTTPLTNAQIVLGSLMSRLYFVLTLLLAGFPIFCITMLFGGVTLREIVISFGLAATTAILTGSLAIAISVIDVGTRRTIFSFYLTIAVYLFAVFALGQWKATHVAGTEMSALAPFHPFLALFAALDRTRPPDPADVSHFGWPGSWALAAPHQTYMTLTLIISAALVVVSMFFVRQSAKEGEDSFAQRAFALLKRKRARLESDGDLRQNPRHVWRNPVAWREAATRASALSRGVTRYGLLGGGGVVGLLLLFYYHQGIHLTVADARLWLCGLIIIEFATVLLVATNTAATAIAREKEADTMDLLLTTPLTSKYIVWGKLRGLISYTIPLLAVPVATVALFVLHDIIYKPPVPILHPEAVLELPVLLLVYSAFACIVGLQTSLKSKKTVKAVLSAVGIMLLTCFLLTACGFAVSKSDTPSITATLAPFTPFTAIAIVIDPYYWLELNTTVPINTGPLRVAALIGCAIAAGVYGAVVAGMYKSMVRHFDMIVRKQST